MVVQMAISRSREFAADATGAQFAGQPYGLAKALEKLDAYSKRLADGGDQATRRHVHRGAVHRGAFMNLFSTHPPIAERDPPPAGPLTEQDDRRIGKTNRAADVEDVEPGAPAIDPRSSRPEGPARKGAERKLREIQATFTRRRPSSTPRARGSSAISRARSRSSSRISSRSSGCADDLDRAIEHGARSRPRPS
jgi:hypothetical protein